MKFGTLLNYFGAVLLLTVMSISVIRVMTREIEALRPDVVHIRIAHTLLDTGLREAIDTLAREYEEMWGGGVRVSQIAIPERIYDQWLRTQLIGETAPELVLATINGMDNSLVSRYFIPIPELIRVPNPYNEGTPLEGLAWRHTFLDGMQRSGFNFALAESFGVPMSATTVRFYANRDLMERILAQPGMSDLREALGSPPRAPTFEEFLELCRGAVAYSRSVGEVIYPIAGSITNGQLIMDHLFQSMTQQLFFDPEWTYRGDFRIYHTHILTDMLAGEKSFDNPEFRSGFELMRQAADFMQPGFLNQREDDALFHFSQGRAMFIAASSTSAPSFRAMIGDLFEMDVYPIPSPGRDHPDYGEFVLGPISEADTMPGTTFAFVNYHPEKNIDQAVDFMRFLTSHYGNQRFSELSGWLPSIVEAEPPARSMPFAPIMEGYPGGPLGHFNNNDFRRIFEVNYHHLFSANGGVDEYFRRVEPEIRRHTPDLIRRDYRNALASIAYQDPLIAAYHRLSEAYPDVTPEADRRVDILVDSSIGNEKDQRSYLPMLEKALERTGGR